MKSRNDDNNSKEEAIVTRVVLIASAIIFTLFYFWVDYLMRPLIDIGNEPVQISELTIREQQFIANPEIRNIQKAQYNNKQTGTCTLLAYDIDPASVSIALDNIKKEMGSEFLEKRTDTLAITDQDLPLPKELKDVAWWDPQNVKNGVILRSADTWS